MEKYYISINGCYTHEYKHIAIARKNFLKIVETAVSTGVNNKWIELVDKDGVTICEYTSHEYDNI